MENGVAYKKKVCTPEIIFLESDTIMPRQPKCPESRQVGKISCFKVRKTGDVSVFYFETRYFSDFS